MIKYNWNVSEDEKKRILNLHETATKRNYLIIEATTSTTTGDPNNQNIKSEVKTFRLPNNTFASGQFQNINQRAADAVVNQMINYIKEFPENQKITIEIESSESRVPNSGVGLKPGELSQRRAETMKTYLEGQNLPTNAVITIKDKGAQGPEWNSKLGANWSGYTIYQYVNFNIIGSGEKPKIPDEPKKAVCQRETIRAKGELALADNDFTVIQEVNIGEGEGMLELTAEAYNIPDCIYV
jgi:outer membrane protein OmpA-like peptidoglycan-associated protein